MKSLLVLAVLISSCGIDPNTESQAEKENWHVSSEPFLSVGVKEGETPYLLHRITGATILPDTNLVIASSGSHELRWFGSDGSFLFSRGSQGNGPGEFSQFSSMRMWVLSDGNLLVDDTYSRRFHLFGPSGEFISTNHIEIPIDLDGTLWIEDVFPDDLTILGLSVSGRLDGKPGDIIESEFRLFSFRTNGGFKERIGSIRSKRRIVNEVDGATHYPFLPFSNRDLVKTNAGGSMVYLKTEGDLLLSDTSSSQMRTINWNPVSVPITDDLYSQYRDYTLDHVSDRRRPLYVGLFSRELPLDKTLPLATSLHRDPTGLIWIERYDYPWSLDDIRMDVVSVDKGWIASVKIPRLKKIFEVGDAYILGVRIADGIEQVVAFRLDRHEF